MNNDTIVTVYYCDRCNRLLLAYFEDCTVAERSVVIIDKDGDPEQVEVFESDYCDDEPTRVCMDCENTYLRGVSITLDALHTFQKHVQHSLVITDTKTQQFLLHDDTIITKNIMEKYLIMYKVLEV